MSEPITDRLEKYARFLVSVDYDESADLQREAIAEIDQLRRGRDRWARSSERYRAKLKAIVALCEENLMGEGAAEFHHVLAIINSEGGAGMSDESSDPESDEQLWAEFVDLRTKLEAIEAWAHTTQYGEAAAILLAIINSEGEREEPMHYTEAFGALPAEPGEELPEDTIRRLRDSEPGEPSEEVDPAERNIEKANRASAKSRQWRHG